MGKKGKDGKKSRKKVVEEIAVSGLAQAVTQTARSMRTALSHSLLDSGLYAGQDGVVLALAEQDGLTPGQLAQKLGVKAPTMTRTIGRMEAQGFVERRPDADDARITKVHLTEAGCRSVEQIERLVADCDRQAIEGLSGKEVRTLVRLLKVVDDNLRARLDTAE